MHYTGTQIIIFFFCISAFTSFFLSPFFFWEGALVTVMAPSCSLRDINQFYNRAQGLVGTSCLALNDNIKLPLITLSPGARVRMLDIPSDFTQSLRTRRKVTQLSVWQHTYFKSILEKNAMNVLGFLTWVLRLVLALCWFLMPVIYSLDCFLGNAEVNTFIIIRELWALKEITTL